jgi:hypothetical protein
LSPVRRGRHIEMLKNGSSASLRCRTIANRKFRDKQRAAFCGPPVNAA